jgi:hypothetical protein
MAIARNVLAGIGNTFREYSAFHSRRYASAVEAQRSCPHRSSRTGRVRRAVRQAVGLAQNRGNWNWLPSTAVGAEIGQRDCNRHNGRGQRDGTAPCSGGRYFRRDFLRGEHGRGNPRRSKAGTERHSRNNHRGLRSALPKHRRLLLSHNASTKRLNYGLGRAEQREDV